MAAVKYNFVYRSGAVAGSPVPSFYTCVGVAEITSPTDGDLAYCTAGGIFQKYSNGSWSEIVGSDLTQRVEVLEFLVAAIIEKGFGGL